MTFVVALAGCASEDPNIVNPPVGDARVLVRLFNTVPDNLDRRLVLESGFETGVVAPGAFSAAVQAPSDSSHLEIFVGGTSEFRTASRARFTRESIFNVYAVASDSAPTVLDTVVLANANRSLTTLPVAQVRIVNVVPDSSVRYDVRIGCPNGEALSSSTIPFRQSSLYKELPPGVAIFSITEFRGSEPRLLGTFQAELLEFTPYTILFQRRAGETEPTITFLNEADFTVNAERALLPVLQRDANIRIANLYDSPATAQMERTSQVIASNIQNEQLSSYATVPTCEQKAADVIQVSFGDGTSVVDSTSLTVRGSYTIVTMSDTAQGPAMLIVPPAAPQFGSSGKALVRVVNTSSYPRGVAVSVGSRTDPNAPNNVSSGIALTQALRYKTVSNEVLLAPGELPLSVASTFTPTTLLAVQRATLEADHSYLIVVADDGDDAVRLYIVDEDDAPGPIERAAKATFVRFVNGSPVTASIVASLGTVAQNAEVFYRNSITTSMRLGNATVSAGTATDQVITEDGKRTLLVYSIKGTTQNIINITSSPLKQEIGLSQRRVINATADIPLVSIAYDTSYASDPETPHVARDVAYGETSAIHELRQERRGTMYAYDSNSFEEIYRLPIDLGPLGNSYSLIVVGNKSRGYEVIVLQEF